MEAVCETCDAPEDVRNMRRVTVQRDLGSDTTRSTGGRRGNRHSISFGGGSGARITNSYSNGGSSRSTTRKRLRNERVWVCNACPDPSNTIGSLRRFFLRIAAIGVLIYAVVLAFGFARDGARSLLGMHMPTVASLESGGSNRDRKEQAANIRDNAALPDSGDITIPAEPARPRFARAKEVVQSLPASRADYPTCSATVTDHCVER